MHLDDKCDNECDLTGVVSANEKLLMFRASLRFVSVIVAGCFAFLVHSNAVRAQIINDIDGSSGSALSQLARYEKRLAVLEERIKAAEARAKVAEERAHAAEERAKAAEMRAVAVKNEAITKKTSAAKKRVKTTKKRTRTISREAQRRMDDAIMRQVIRDTGR